MLRGAEIYLNKSVNKTTYHCNILIRDPTEWFGFITVQKFQMTNTFFYSRYTVRLIWLFKGTIDGF